MHCAIPPNSPTSSLRGSALTAKTTQPMSLLSGPYVLQQTRDVQTDILRDKTAILGNKLRETSCRRNSDRRNFTLMQA